MCALAAALPLLLGAGGVAAQDTLPTVSVSDAEAYEDGRFVQFEVSLSQASSEQVTVEFATSSGTARSGTDFRAWLQTVTFPAHSTDPQSVLVSLRNDQTPEPDETFTVTLTNPVGATLGDATATGTIRNDDTAATLAASGIGETSATLTISGYTDGWWYKGGEYALGYDGQAWRILRRNVHSCRAVAAGTTAVSIGGLTAARSHDYRAYSDSTCSTRLARTKFKTLAPEGTPTVSVSDAEVSEDGAWMDFTVSLSQGSRERVTVRAHTSSGTATSGADFRHVSRTLVFSANSETPQSVRVFVHDDEEPEPDETFTVRLTNPVGATLGDATATGTIRDDGDTAATLTPSDIEDTTARLTIAGHTDDWWYKGNAHACTAVVAGTTAVSIGGLTTVTDYEYAAYSDSACSTRLARTKFKTLAPEGTPTVSISDAEVSEDGGDVTFAVSLSHPSREPVTVEVHTSSGTATSGYDFVGGPQTLTFHANSSRITRYARVGALDDEEPEPDETFTATLRVPVGATLGDATATGTIRDDGDTAATLTASDIEDTTATLTISGHTDGWWYRGGNADLCTAVAAGTTAVSISGLTTVTDYELTAYSDSTCSTRLARVEFRTLAPAGTPTVSISDAEAYEDGTWISFKVSLSHPSRKRVFVKTESSNGTATGTHGDFAPGIDFRHEHWGSGVIFEANSPETTASVSMIVFDDQEPEPDETFTVTLTRASNATLGDATATGTILDDGDTAATLTASDIEDTTATLTISGHTDAWWYRERIAHSCTPVAAGTTAVSIGGLTTVTSYVYTAFSDSGCSTKLARVKFRTIAPEGTPTVSVSDAAVSEDSQWIRFELSLSHPSREPVTVWYETSGGTAASGTDYRAESGTVTLSANSWNFNPPVSVLVYDDQEAEPDETFTVTLTRATGATLGDATATGTITDDGDTAATLTASDIEDTTATLTIAGHTDGWWYRGRAHSCTAVAAGTTAVSISGLTAVTSYEYTAYSGSGCSTKLAEVEFKTLAAEATPTVSVSDAEVSEDGTRMFFLVSLSHPVRREVTVDVHTSGGTATSGTDFEAVSQTLTFPANSGGRETLPVLVHDDQELEPDETFTVTLTNPTGATLGDATATGTITDDGDTAARLTPSDIEDTTATLTIADHTDGWWYKGNAHACTAVAAGTAAVSISGLTTVTDYDYTAYSDSACSTKLARVKFRTLAPEGTPTVSVSDAEVSEDGTWMQFRVSLSQPSREQVTVDVRTSDGTATGGTDFKAVSQTLTFPANSSGRASLPVLVHDDQEPEPDETFTLTLTNATGATLGDATATGTILDDGDTPATLTSSEIEDTTATLTISRHTDGWWYKGNAHACTAVAAGTTAVSISGLTAVTDYEYTAYGDSACSTKLDKVEFRTLAPEGTPTVSISDAEVSEDGTWMQFRVSLSQPSRAWVSVQYVTSDGTATGGTDFRAGSGRVLFFPNSSETTLPASVIVHDDQEPEPDETFTVKLTNATGATLGDATATGTIRDDDAVATGVTVASDPGSDATYGAGDTVRVEVAFSEAVEVDTADGTPRLKLDLGGNAGGRWAAYEDGSGTETLTFAWTATAPDESAVGVAVLADTLELNGGTIRSAATQADAALGHPGRDHDPAHKVDAVAPSVANASVSGSALTVTFDEALAAAASLRNGAFSVKKTPSGGTEAAVDLSTTVAPAISGRTVTLTLASAVVSGDTAVKVSYTTPTSGSANRLVDAVGNQVADFADRAVANVTGLAVTEVTVVSDPGADATYAAGDTVRVEVTFSEAVEVGTEDGTPRLKLDLGGDDGAGERWAAYEGGSDTKTLAFAWTAAAPDESAEGVAVLADTLELNGGTIASVATQTAAALGHPGRDPDPAHKVDAVAPRLLRGEIDGGTMRLHFSEALDPDSTGGDFLMAVETPERGVVGFDAAGAVTVEGAVVTVGLRLDLGYPGATAGLDRNSVSYWRRADGSDGALRDPAGNLVAAPRKSRTTDGVAMRFFRTDLENVTGPTTSVTGVAVVSDAGSDDTYVLGDTIRVQVTFNETVEVTGSPRLKIDMDPAHWGEKWAAYESGSGTGSLTFVHTVVEPNYSTQGIAVLENTLELNGGTIRSDGADANLAHDGRPHDANHKVDWRTQPENDREEEPAGQGGDDGPPAVTGVRVMSSPASGHTYLLGETIRIRATFSEPVSVTGSPRISIDMDPAHWGTKRAAYASGGGTSSLDFVHTVVEPNYSTQGIAVLANSLALNGGTIRSADGTNAALGHSGRGHDSGHKVDWRPTISVADARADEGAGAKVAFEVSLSRAFTTAHHRVTVDYATADGTAKAGEDYTATSGTLTFAAGERTKTVNVPVLDDAIDEGEETFVLRLSNVQGARAGDLEATGTIANDDPLQKMWLSRFGRTVAGHVTDAVSDRLAKPLSGAQVTVDGQRVDIAQAEDGAALTQALTAVARALGASEQQAPGDRFASGSHIPASGAGGWPGTAMGVRGSSALDGTLAREVSGRELLLGSAFHLAREGDGAGPGLAAWGRATVGGFDGEAPAGAGSMRIDGEVTTGILGADAEWNRLLAGVAVSLSEGEGTFSQPGVDSGKIESTMTAVSPYARFMVNDRISVWGLAGWGTGDMTITQAANENQPERITRTDIEMRLAALGGRGALMQADETGGIDLGLRADAFYAETEAEPVSNEGGTTAVASRVRLALEGSHAFEMSGGSVLTPGLELGLRHDGGDAETGTGVELGGRVTWTDPDTGLSVEARVRTLIAHEDSDYREWGASGAVRLAPGDRGRGLSFSLAPTWGAASGGVDRLWSARDARGLAPESELEAGQRLEGELGYGFGLFGDRFTGTPNLGFGLSDNARDYRIGWRLTSAVRGDPGFEVSLDATRREAVNDNEPAEHGVMLRGAIRW